ncbi:hemolysin family protein [Flavicella sp.]|uniref:hemolysin family protein n=1 Tax=Flavicella sp. TaxID=2957742 RepID=UPI0026052833|nr:hemolysin family protein [Flavicella sp.]MDG1804465.1 hemolysin family protein [Flavicella sp.]
MEIEITIIIASILFSAFFSGMEIAFISANKLHIELEKKREGLAYAILAKLTDNSSKFITTMLVGNNVSLVIYSYYMGKLLVDIAVPLIPFELNELLVLFIQTFVSTIVILISAEFLPKAIFRIYANETLKFFVFPAYFFYLIFYFITDFISKISDYFLRTFFNTNADEDQKEFSKEELGDYITEQLDTSDETKEIDSEIQIFQNALDFYNVKAREIMVPRTEITAVEIHETVANLKSIFVETGLSKILVYKTSLDDVVGYVRVFDLFKRPKSIKSVLMPVEVVPESISISDVLNVLTKKKKSIALVLDEYGGTSGMITVEDIIEEIFGEIEDEHDSIELIDEKVEEGIYKFSARLEIDHINDTYNLEIPKEESYETLGGFILEHTESIPEKEALVKIGDFEIQVTKVSGAKIEEVVLKVI